MKQYAEHDKVGVCHALRSDDIYAKSYSGGYPYIKEGAIIRSNIAQPIYSYGKNYERNGEKFALFVWTTNGNQADIEKLLDSVSKKVSKETIEKVSSDNSFVYID